MTTTHAATALICCECEKHYRATSPDRRIFIVCDCAPDTYRTWYAMQLDMADALHPSEYSFIGEDRRVYVGQK